MIEKITSSQQFLEIDVKNVKYQRYIRISNNKINLSCKKLNFFLVFGKKYRQELRRLIRPGISHLNIYIYVNVYTFVCLSIGLSFVHYSINHPIIMKLWENLSTLLQIFLTLVKGLKGKKGYK